MVPYRKFFSQIDTDDVSHPTPDNHWQGNAGSTRCVAGAISHRDEMELVDIQQGTRIARRAHAVSTVKRVAARDQGQGLHKFSIMCFGASALLVLQVSLRLTSLHRILLPST